MSDKKAVKKLEEEIFRMEGTRLGEVGILLGVDVVVGILLLLVRVMR
jgi:tetrahydromethanopterin S-methyltransferase subunit G